MVPAQGPEMGPGIYPSPSMGSTLEGKGPVERVLLLPTLSAGECSAELVRALDPDEEAEPANHSLASARAEPTWAFFGPSLISQTREMMPLCAEVDVNY